MGISNGLEKIRMEPGGDIICIAKNYGQNDELQSIKNGIEIVCPEISLDVIRAKCFGLLDASVIFPIG